jgi:geranylgeranylglycerol-phosphate geranylgeranyltransferase
MLYFYKITRPTTCLFIILITYLGFMCNNVNDYNIIIPTIISNVLTVGSTNALNDIFDYNIDKLVFPNRPLPSGKISIYNTILFVIVLNLISLIVSYSHTFYYNTLSMLIGIIYTPILKYYHFITKNFSCALVGCIFYLSAIEKIHNISYFTLIWLFTDSINYEMYKDIRDINADKKFGCITFPVKYGIQNTLIYIWVNNIISSVILLFFDDIGISLFLMRILGNMIIDIYHLYNSFSITSSFRYQKKLLIFFNLFIIMTNQYFK